MYESEEIKKFGKDIILSFEKKILFLFKIFKNVLLTKTNLTYIF